MPPWADVWGGGSNENLTLVLAKENRMIDKKDTLVERAQQAYRQLSVAANTLNAASDKLGTSVANLDVALKKLNLGISSWVHFREGSSDDGYYYSYQDIGYAKIGGTWGLAIKTVSGDVRNLEDEECEQWSFNEAPRNLRVQAVKKIPDLLEKLIKDAADITKKVVNQTEEVDVLTKAISEIAAQPTQEAAQHAKSKR